MYINKLKPTINYNNISNNFKILSITDKKNNKYPPSNLFLENFQEKTGCRLVSSVNKRIYGPALYLLIDKKTYNYDKVLDFIGIGYTIQELNVIENIHPAVLSQLFINIFNGYEYKKFTNITGRLFLPVIMDEKKKIIICLEISVDNNMFLNLDVVTFSLMNEYNIKNKKGNIRWQYNVMGETMNRVKHHDKNDGTIYVEKGYGDKKQALKFLGLINDDSKHSYNKSKLGILSKVFHVIEKEFSDYISFSFEEKYMNSIVNAEKDFLWIKDVKEMENIYNEINRCELNIVNKINQDITLFCEYLNSINIKYEISENLCKEKYNVIIIHDEDYYSKNELLDEHSVYRDCVVSHMTYENSLTDIKKKTNNDKETWSGTSCVDVILKELIIKYDLLIRKRISILDLKALGLEDPIIFAMYDNENGISFLEFNEETLLYYNDESSKALLYENVMDYLEKNTKDIVVIYKDNIIAISTDNIYPIIDIKKAYTFFGENYGKRVLFKKSTIVKHMKKVSESFKKDKLELKEKYENLYDIYKEDDTDVSYFDFCEEESISKNDSVIVSMFTETNKMCAEFYRNKEFVNYIYPELVGIKYFEENNDKYYWVGIFTGEKYQSIDKASIIRKVKVIEGEDFFINIVAPLLEVQFVKWADQTVYPFPVKYLREAIEYMNV